MRNYFVLALGIAIAASSLTVVPTAYAGGPVTETCDSLVSCSWLQFHCQATKGSYGGTTSPDGSVWGICVHTAQKDDRDIDRQ